MKKFLVLTATICLILASHGFAQDVAICYDSAVEGGGGLAVPNPDQLAEMIVKELADKGLTGAIVDSAALAEYMKANPKGIFVATQGIMPGTIFKKAGTDDLIHSWLRGGGIGAFIGDYAFYYYWDPDTNARVTAAGGGQQSVFGFTVTNGTVTAVKPTELGKKYIPSLKDWSSNRPTGLAVLKDNNFEYESYADDGTNADPIAYRTEDMEGWFINFHTSCCGTVIPPNDQIAKEYAELISNRFAPVETTVQGGGGLAVPNPKGLAEMMVEELKAKKLTAKIVDSDELAEYMKANPKGIYILTQGLTPGTIFKKQGKKDLVYTWLRGGGIGGFIGDYAFYYYWDKGVRITAAGAGQQSVFGFTVTNGTVSQVTPTELGKKYIPSLKKWSSNRPSGLAVLKANNFEYESYADDGVNADPIAYRTKDMKGWFINFHTSCCGTVVPPNDQMAKEYAELISNRFAEPEAVDPKSKLSVVWGELKLSD